MENLTARYVHLLARYLSHPDLVNVEEPRALGRELLKKQHEPADIVHLHQQALRDYAAGAQAVESRTLDLSLKFLAEVLRSYGIDPLRPLVESSVTSHFVAEVLRELQEQTAISDLGRIRIGRRYAENVQGNLENCLQIFHMQGLGSLRLVSTSDASGTIIMQGSDLFESMEKSPCPQDHFTRGFLAGVISRLVGQDMNCEEVSCRARGDDCCRFVISPVERQPIVDLREKLSHEQ